jgi:hypothetical protein
LLRQSSRRVKNSLLKARLYLETTVPSYLTAWLSRDLIRASHQQITHEWWESRRTDFEVFISQLVPDEVAAGDPAAARERLAALKDLPQLDITEDVALPAKASTDAAHIALAAVHGMHFLLTWNCTHIANAEMAVAIAKVCQDHEFTAPVICTPEELMGK